MRGNVEDSELLASEITSGTLLLPFMSRDKKRVESINYLDENLRGEWSPVAPLLVRLCSLQSVLYYNSRPLQWKRLLEWWIKYENTSPPDGGMLKWIIKWFDVLGDWRNALPFFEQNLVSLVANVLTGFCGGSRRMQQLDDPDSNLLSGVTWNKVIEVEGLKALFCREKICENLWNLCV